MATVVNLNDDSEAILNEIMSTSDGDFGSSSKSNTLAGPPQQPEGEEKGKKAIEAHVQWALGADGKFMPVGATTPTLPSGIYEPFATPSMWGLEKLNISSDGIYILPDMATKLVLDEARKFWESEPKYRAHKLLYKRGILLFGPPGGGKTVAVKLLIEELVKQDGIVILVSNVNLALVCLKAVRRVEPKRNIIVVFEDIDEILAYNGEAAVLSMLDGENNVDNILHIATTNYPERLGPRIINRPSRFDRRVHVGMPTFDARRAYLDQATNSGLSSDSLDKWAHESDGMSIAHLRELVAAVYCLDQPYEDVINRLSEMAKAVKADESFKKNAMGFGGNRGTRGTTITAYPDSEYN